MGTGRTPRYSPIGLYVLGLHEAVFSPMPYVDK
jgi:hypothetical protein